MAASSPADVVMTPSTPFTEPTSPDDLTQPTTPRTPTPVARTGPPPLQRGRAFHINPDLPRDVQETLLQQALARRVLDLSSVADEESFSDEPMPPSSR